MQSDFEFVGYNESQLSWALLDQCMTLGTGSYKLGYKWLGIIPRDKGWVHINQRDEMEFGIHWTSHQETHQPLCGNSYILVVDKDGLISYAKSHITMWLVWHREFPQYQEEDKYQQAFTKLQQTVRLIEEHVMERNYE